MPRAITRTTLPLALAAAALAACVDPPPGELPPGELPADEPIPGERTAETTAALTGDPSATGGGWCYGNYSWNGTAARIYWPANDGCTASVYSPLVVMTNGYGYSHTDYHYLMRHLAQHGYIAVSIDAIPAGTTAAAYQAAADKAWAFVTDYVWTHWSRRFFIDPSRVGVMGHSRGGLVAQYLAATLQDDPIFNVRAVVSLAPTNHHTVNLTAADTHGVMVLVAAGDTDTLARSAYALHDRTSSDASQLDPLVNPDVVFRSMKLFTGGNHDGFGNEGSWMSGPTRGYALAFLHAHLKDDVTYYEDYVRGDDVPAGYAPGMTSQYSDGLFRRVIDNFDDGNIATSTIGSSVSVAIGGAGGVIDLGAQTWTPHETWALRFDPPPSGAGFLWSIPAGKRDFTPYGYLSLRVGQRSGPVTDDLRIRVINGGVTSPWVRLTDHGALPRPLDMCTTPSNGLACITPPQQLAHMGTIRIPLGAFGAHGDVSVIELGAAAEAIDGEFIVDNLEVSEWIP